MDQNSIREIKQEFFKLCDVISLEEVCSNEPLIAIIERIERLILTLEAEMDQADGFQISR